MRSTKLFGLLTAAVVLPIVTNGCSSDGSNPLCCSEFKTGADQSSLASDLGVDASISGQFTAFAQASSDLSSTADAMITDVSSACKAIATDLGASQTDLANAENQAPRARVTAYCNLAVAAIQNNAVLKAAGTLTVGYTPPQCSASIDAYANCQAKCSVNGSCDIKANPPTCKGGTLSVSCSGSCAATATVPSVTCEGSCTGSCSGACEVTPGGASVECDGTCQGQCAAGGSAGGSGLQADGSCKGVCNGRCTLRTTETKVNCAGSCTGKCTGTCQVQSGSASFRCDGQCSVTGTAPSCEGGTLEGGCQVDANCQANCSASINARAQCTPPEVAITASGTVNATEFQAVIRTIETNLPQVLIALKGHGSDFLGNIQATAQGGASLVASGKVTGKPLLCVTTAMAPAAVEAGTNASVALQAAQKLTASLNIQ